jgi:hypothetical protein
MFLRIIMMNIHNPLRLNTFWQAPTFSHTKINVLLAFIVSIKKNKKYEKFFDFFSVVPRGTNSGINSGTNNITTWYHGYM